MKFFCFTVSKLPRRFRQRTSFPEEIFLRKMEISLTLDIRIAMMKPSTTGKLPFANYLRKVEFS
jgi:hypothetical protein